MLHYHFSATFQGGIGDEILINAQITSGVLTTMDFVAVLGSTVPIGIVGATEVGDRCVKPNGGCESRVSAMSNRGEYLNVCLR